MYRVALFFICTVSTMIVVSSCAAPHKELSQTQMEICKEIDFDLEPSMRELCGARKMKFMQYRNIPRQRFLINPKNAYLVKVDESVELRLPRTAPIDLGSDLLKKLEFTKEARLTSIKNKYHYLEKFIGAGKRVKMFKLGIPVDDGSVSEYCFTIPQSKKRDRTRSIPKNRVYRTKCSEYDSLAVN